MDKSFVVLNGNINIKYLLQSDALKKQNLFPILPLMLVVYFY